MAIGAGAGRLIKFFSASFFWCCCRFDSAQINQIMYVCMCLARAVACAEGALHHLEQQYNKVRTCFFRTLPVLEFLLIVV